MPIGNLVAAVNMDMPILLYDFTDVIAFGASHSSLQQVAANAAKQVGLTLTPDPMPDQAIFTRTDHYRFVQQGVPSISLATGWNTPAGKGEGGKVFNEFLERHYHKPSDDLNLPIDYNAGARFARVNYLIARGATDADARPTWNTATSSEACSVRASRAIAAALVLGLTAPSSRTIRLRPSTTRTSGPRSRPWSSSGASSTLTPQSWWR